jgi:activator of 2-hydroxyglutaryl-CoA dehydratase
VISDYRRILGSPIESACELLEEFFQFIAESRVDGIRATGSGGRRFAEGLGVAFENEFKAIARGVAFAYPQVRTVFEMGGESSKYMRLGSSLGRRNDPQGSAGNLGIVD